MISVNQAELLLLNLITHIKQQKKTIEDLQPQIVFWEDKYAKQLAIDSSSKNE